MAGAGEVKVHPSHPAPPQVGVLPTPGSASLPSISPSAGSSPPASVTVAAAAASSSPAATAMAPTAHAATPGAMEVTAVSPDSGVNGVSSFGPTDSPTTQTPAADSCATTAQPTVSGIPSSTGDHRTNRTEPQSGDRNGNAPQEQVLGVASCGVLEKAVLANDGKENETSRLPEREAKKPSPSSHNVDIVAEVARQHEKRATEAIKEREGSSAQAHEPDMTAERLLPRNEKPQVLATATKVP